MHWLSSFCIRRRSKPVPHVQATNSVMQRAGINRSFTGMGSRASSTGKLPMSRTASGSVLDRQEGDAGNQIACESLARFLTM